MTFTRPEIFRPPSEWRSYYLPLTSGCSNNTCIFCNYYDTKLRIRDIAEVKREIDALELYTKHGLEMPGIHRMVYAIANQWDGQMVFLQDGDALAYPQAKLVEVLEHLNAKFPNLERIGTYATAGDILRRSVDELRELKRLKLGIFYMGVETGDNELLEHIGKGANYDQMVEAGKKTKAAGIIMSATVILGIGGTEGSQRHALATARILTDIDPEYAGALTVTLVPGTPLYEQIRKGEFKLITPFQSLQELRTIVENASFSHCFFSSMHASNYFSIRGWLPEEKNRLLEELDYVLNSKDPALLKPEYFRGL